jgi:hypothetical protein
MDCPTPSRPRESIEQDGHRISRHYRQQARLARRAAIEPLALAVAALACPSPYAQAWPARRDRSDHCRVDLHRGPPVRAVERARNANRRWKHGRKHRRGSDNVIPFRLVEGIQPSRADSRICLSDPAPFDTLTVALILAQHRAGTLPEAVLLALLAGVGLDGDIPPSSSEGGRP